MRDRIPVTRRFADLGDADAVELPYQGGQLAMWLIVPREPGGLAAVEETLSAEALTGLDSAARKGSVHLTMPTWEQELPPADLFGWLCPLGFCTGATFDNIAPGIMITAALHGAKIIVDEKGTEAAAATAMAFVTSEPPPPDLTVVADRPFLWAIVHQGHGSDPVRRTPRQPRCLTSSSGGQRYSARLRHLVTWPGVRAAPCLVREASWPGM